MVRRRTAKRSTTTRRKTTTKRTCKGRRTNKSTNGVYSKLKEVFSALNKRRTIKPVPLPMKITTRVG